MLRSWIGRSRNSANGARHAAISLIVSGLIGASLVLPRIGQMGPREDDERIRPERLGERGPATRREDPRQLARADVGIEVMEDRLADRKVETPRLERQGLAAGDVELDPVGDAVELGPLPGDLDARLRQVERCDERSAPGQHDR